MLMTVAIDSKTIVVRELNKNFKKYLEIIKKISYIFKKKKKMTKRNLKMKGDKKEKKKRRRIVLAWEFLLQIEDGFPEGFYSQWQRKIEI